MRALLVAVAMVVVVAGAILVACGGGARATRSNYQRDPTYGRTHGDTPAPPPDAGVAFTGTRPLSCPASFPASEGSCDAKVSTETCSYPEGSCYCGVTMPCSGVEHDPAEVAKWPTTWQCTRPPPAVRPDGCPGSQPGEGSACASDRQSCGWGECCFTQMTCTKGKWVTTGGGCPP